MGVPFNYQGEIQGRINGSIELITNGIMQGLVKVKADKITVSENMFKFSGGFFRAVPNWNLLIGITSGTISITKAKDETRVKYTLNFTKMIWAALIQMAFIWAICVCFIMDFRIWKTPMSVAVLLPLIPFGMSWLTSIIRFRR
jgi:hypothetical protein